MISNLSFVLAATISLFAALNVAIGVVRQCRIFSTMKTQMALANITADRRFELQRDATELFRRSMAWLVVYVMLFGLAVGLAVAL